MHFPELRMRVDSENHLPCTVLLMKLGVRLHFIVEVPLIGNKTIRKSDEPIIFK